MNNENEFQPQQTEGQNTSGSQEFVPSSSFAEGFTSSSSNAGQMSQGNYDPDQESSAMAVVSLVLGILSIVCCCIPWLPTLFAIIGLILGIIVLAKGKPGKVMAIIAIVCSGISILLALVGLIAGTALTSNPEYQNFMRQLQDELNSQ